MLVKIDHKNTHNLVKKVMVENYKNIQGDIKRLSKKKTLAAHEQEEFKYFIELSKAFEKLIGYYFSVSEAKEIIEKNSHGLHLAGANPNEESCLYMYSRSLYE